SAYLEDADPTLVPMVYEVFRVHRHRCLFLDEHMERMFRSINMMGFNEPYSREQITGHLNELLDTEPDRIGNIKIRLSWWPQPILEIGYIPHRYPTSLEATEGVDVVTYHAVRNTPNIKLWNAALRERTNLELKEKGVFEVLLVNEAGLITEGGRSNLFYVRNNELFTAPLETVLPGITRQKVIELAGELGIRLHLQHLPEAEVGLVDELFTSGTSAGVCPIRAVNGLTLPALRPVTNRLREAYEQLVEQQFGPNSYGW
ncbi:MAG: aminotransferase class IV, partial [Bacteroidales bacterium]